MAIRNFTDEEVQLLKQIARWFKRSGLSSPTSSKANEVQSSSRSSYVALLNSSIAGLTITGTGGSPGSGDVPGSGTASIYQNTSQGLLLVEANVAVYNMSEDTLLSNRWYYVDKDMFGYWWVVNIGAASGTASGTAGTGTCGDGITDATGNTILWSTFPVTTTPDYIIGIEGGCVKRVEVAYCPTGTGSV